MYVLVNFDFSDPTQAALFASIAPYMVSCTPEDPRQVQEIITAPVQNSSNVAPRTGLSETFVGMYVIDADGFVHCCTSQGKYIFVPTVRKIFNQRLKAAGATWNKEHKAWEFKGQSSTYVEAIIPTLDTTVTVEQYRQALQERFG